MAEIGAPEPAALVSQFATQITRRTRSVEPPPTLRNNGLGFMSGTTALIDGKYELTEKVGEGGMAVVWRATMHGAAGFTRPVAVKKIRQRFDASDHYIRMFVEEARVGSELAHPNIVQVMDFCMDDAGSYYLIMEWVDGIDLADFVNAYSRVGERVPWDLAVAVGVGALRGLAAAHERRRPDGVPAPVVHRDISPHNILLASNGVAKVTDFGLARARDRIHSLTGPGVVKGKLGYWAPEVASGGDASALSDIFAMGIVLWESLVGHSLFTGEHDAHVLQQVLACEVPSLDEVRPGLPARLTAAVDRALRAAPEERFKTARDMAQELANVLREAPPQDAQGALSDQILRARHRLGGRFLPRKTPPLGVPVIASAAPSGETAMANSGVPEPLREAETAVDGQVEIPFSDIGSAAGWDPDENES